MFEQLIWYLKGYVRIRVTGYSPERFLNACRYKNIYIWDLKRVCGSYEMNLTIDGFRRLKEIVRKTGTKVCIIRRSGLPFLLYYFIQFEADAQCPAEVERHVRIMDNVLRYLVVRKDA